jgi:hypothetical protein
LGTLGAPTERGGYNELATPSDHQWTLPAEPIGPGAYAPSPGTVSPGTVAVFCKLDCPVVGSSGEAQAEIRNAIAKKKRAHLAKRLIIGTNLNTAMFDASRAGQ